MDRCYICGAKWLFHDCVIYLEQQLKEFLDTVFHLLDQNIKLWSNRGFHGLDVSSYFCEDVLLFQVGWVVGLSWLVEGKAYKDPGCYFPDLFLGVHAIDGIDVLVYVYEKLLDLVIDAVRDADCTCAFVGLWICWDNESNVVYVNHKSCDFFYDF